MGGGTLPGLGLLLATSVALTGCASLTASTGRVMAEAAGGRTNVSVGSCTDTTAFSFESTDEDAPEFREIDPTEVPVVDCAQPHRWEAHAEKKVQLEGEFPGNDAMDAMGLEFCGAEFEPFVGREYDESSLDQTWTFPSEETWAQGDRTITCFVGLPEGGITGPLRGSGR